MKCLQVLLVVSLLGGRTRGIDKADLPGVYVFEIDGQKQQITLKANGDYFNSFYKDGALSWTDSNSWTYEQQSSESGITFSKFRFGLKGYSDRPGFWFVVPEKTFTGRKQLCFDPDLHQCFRAT